MWRKLFPGILAIALAVASLWGLSTLGTVEGQPDYGGTGVVLKAGGPATGSAGAIVDVTCTVVDEDGQPVVNQLIVFQITSDPGDAQLQRTSGVSNTEGFVTVPLYLGTTPGDIEGVCSSGNLEAAFQAGVLGVSITPPNTGNGGLH